MLNEISQVKTALSESPRYYRGGDIEIKPDQINPINSINPIHPLHSIYIY
jgi:hypothetical protein